MDVLGAYAEISKLHGPDSGEFVLSDLFFCSHLIFVGDGPVFVGGGGGGGRGDSVGVGLFVWALWLAAMESFILKKSLKGALA